MTALVIVQVRPRAAEKLAEYSAAAAATVKAFGGEFIQRGKFLEALAGHAVPHGLGIIQFPTPKDANDWYASAEYQAIIPLRNEAADMSFLLYETA